MTSVLIVNYSFVFLYFVILYFWCVKKNDFSLIDLGWGLGHFIVYLSCFFQYGPKQRTILLGFLLLFWVYRLTSYLSRRAKNRAEDFRYKKIREGMGPDANKRAFYRIFVLQSILLIMTSFVIQVVASQPVTSLNWLDGLGVVVFFVGFFIEHNADKQVFDFKKNYPTAKNKFLTSGLWKYSRHPNYFGEALLWFGIAILSQSWIGFLSPIFLTFLLTKISGIPLLEAKYQGNRDYEIYKSKTSAFIPWFPKNSL